MEHIAITIDNYDICKTSDIEKKNDYQFLRKYRYRYFVKLS